MNTDDIITFVKLAENKNFTRTADALYTTQSNVSARIKSLEQTLGQQLFFRNKKQVDLTPAGISFLNYATQIINLVDASKQALKFSAKFSYQLTVAAPESFWDTILIPALDNILKTSDKFSLRLFCAHSEQIIPSIINNTIDIGIVCSYPSRCDLECIPFQKNRFMLVRSPHLTLPDIPFTPQTISQFPFIYVDWSQMFTEWLSTHYYTKIHFLEAETTFILIKLILLSRGIGFIPERFAKPYIKSERLIEIPYLLSEHAPIESSFIIYNRNKEATIRPILNELNKYKNI